MSGKSTVTLADVKRAARRAFDAVVGTIEVGKEYHFNGSVVLAVATEVGLHESLVKQPTKAIIKDRSRKLGIQSFPEDGNGTRWVHMYLPALASPKDKNQADRWIALLETRVEYGQKSNERTEAQIAEDRAFATRLKKMRTKL